MTKIETDNDHTKLSPIIKAHKDKLQDFGQTWTNSKTGVPELNWDMTQKEVFIDAKHTYDNAGKRNIFMG